ncbi:MAG: ABC transporter substrate-binding protein [Chitinispirillales bacterium]|jgi:peptide/nickel transport system substrate-binding protein|nr:ABC transporter substrate-binding protein [Chitinispirillales bacterium]
MKKFFVLAIILIICAGCNQKQSSKPQVSPQYSLSQLDSAGKAFVPEIGKYGETINLALSSDPDGFCPALTNSGYSMEVLGLIFEGLVATNAVDLEHKPNIAKNWDVSDDGLTWKFYLRNDVYFSDGVKLSSADVLFTFNDIVYNEKLNSPLNYNFRVDGKKINVSAADSFSVIFELPTPFAPFLTVVGMSIMPKHLYEKYAKDGTLESFLSSGTNVKNVVGSGPFMLSKVELGQQIILAKNPYYWKKDAENNRLPYLDAVRFAIIQEPNMQTMMFQSGKIDHYMLSGEHYPILKPKEFEGNYKLYRVGPRWYDRFFVFNQNNQIDEKTGKYFLDPKKQKWFRTKEFRQACAYAINYDEIIRIVFNGLAYMPGGVWGNHKGKYSDPNLKQYYYDLQKADSLLNSIGYSRNGDGIRKDDLGNPIEFTITTTAGVERISRMFGIVRKDLEQLGFKVHLDFVEFNTMISRIYNTYNWDIAAYSLGGIVDPHFGKETNIPSSPRYQINPQRQDKNGKNIPKIDRDYELRISEIFEEAVKETNDEKRAKLYFEWQNIDKEQCHFVYLPMDEVILGLQNKFGNIHLTSRLNSMESLTHNIEEIYIK